MDDDELLTAFTATEPIKSTAAEPSPEIGNTTVLPRSNIDWSDRETLILIYSLLFAIAVFSLMCAVICFIWCRKKRRSHDFKTTFWGAFNIRFNIVVLSLFITAVHEEQLSSSRNVLDSEICFFITAFLPNVLPKDAQSLPRSLHIYALQSSSSKELPNQLLQQFISGIFRSISEDSVGLQLK